MAEKKEIPKVVLEREYIIPLRKEWIKVPRYKRAPKAIKAIKEFLVKHMKIYNRNLNNIKINRILNNEIWFRGIKKPPAKIKIIAKKLDNGLVDVELVDIPAIVKFKIVKEERIKSKIEKVVEKKKDLEEKKELSKIEKGGTREVKEKEESSKEESLKIAKEQAREFKHVSKIKEEKIHRKALNK